MDNATHKEEKRAYAAAYYAAHKEKKRAYYAAHKEKMRAYDTAYYAAHKKERRAYRAAHKEERRAHDATRYYNDINYRLRVLLRARLWLALKKNSKLGSAVRDLGCTINEFREYLESLFTEGMTWENFGKWSLDHIIPLYKFDLTDRDQFLRACNFTNIQPMWLAENMSKGDRISPSGRQDTFTWNAVSQ